MTIGVFSDDANTNWVPVNGGWQTVFHYYYDDVSVKKILPNSISKVVNPATSVFPNPSNGIINITSETEIESYEVLTMTGEIIVSEVVNTDNTSIDLTFCSVGFYLVKIKSQQFTSFHKIIVNN